MKKMKQLIAALLMLICMEGYGQCGPYTLTAIDSNCISFVLSVSGASAAQQIIWNLDGVFDTVNSGPIYSGITIAGGNGQGSAANQLSYPWGICLDALGNLYVADQMNNRILKFPAGSTSATNGITVAGGNGAGIAANQINQPAGICVDGSGNLYVADERNDRIQKFPAGSTSATNGITVAGGNGGGNAANQLYEPEGVYVDASGNIYVADYANFRIQKFPAGSTSATNGITVAGGNGGGNANQLDGPAAVYVDVTGNIYVADDYNNRIQKFPANSTSDTNGITVAGGNGQGEAANQFHYPRGIYVDVSGNIYVADENNSRIQKFPPNSTSATNGITVAGVAGFGGYAANKLWQPQGVYVDASSNIYIVDQGNDRIQKWLQPSAIGIDTSLLVTSLGPYSAKVKDTFGCITSSDTIIQSIILAISNTSVTNTSCPGLSDGSITAFVTGGTPGYTYNWSNGASFSNILNNLPARQFCLTVTDSHACTASICDSVESAICQPDSTVWPGDADANHIVDNTDLLTIGLAYDSIGPVRAMQGIVWQADQAINWNDSFSVYAPAVNFKHADCNGDGIINSADTVAIMANYSLTHAKTGPMLSPWRNGIPAIKAVLTPDTAYNGDTLTVTFVLGDTNTTVNNLYGLAFRYNFDPLVVDSTFPTRMGFLPTSWMGTPSQKISINKIFPTTGQIQAAVTRINHTSASGHGAIATASFKITTDNISGKNYSYYTNKWSITDVIAIDQYGHPIQLNAGADSSTVGFYPTGIREVTTETLHIQPNPARDKVLISAGNVIKEISLSNIMGQQVMNGNTTNSRSVSIDVSGLESGVYVVQVKTDKGTGIAKLIIEK